MKASWREVKLRGEWMKEEELQKPKGYHKLPHCPGSVFINEDGNIECLMCGRITKTNGEIIRKGGVKWQTL